MSHRDTTEPERENLLELDPITPKRRSLDDGRSRGRGPMEISRLRRTSVLAGLWLATFLYSLNTTLVATLVSSISSEFKRSNEASWLGTSFLLAMCTFTPLYGRLCNVAGRRTASLLAISLCGIGTVACGFASNMHMLIAARFIAGMGGGGILTTASICTSDMYTMRDRTLTQGLASIFQGAGMGLGGPLGGYISDRYGWRCAFLCQLPLFIVAFGFVSTSLNYTTPGKGKNSREVLGRIDFMGSGALFCAVASCLAFLSFKYNQDHHWDDIRVTGSIFSSVLFAGAFVFIELYIATEPVLSPAFLRQKVPVLVGLSNLAVSACNFAVQYHFPMWFETVKGTSAALAGLHLMPNSVAMSTGSLFAGFVMHQTGKYYSLNVVFGIFPAAAAFLISRLKPDSHPLIQWVSILPLGFGNAVVLQTTLMALLAAIPHSDIAVGTGFTILFKGIGQVSGVAISSAVFQGLLARHLRQRITGADSEKLIRRIRHSFKFVESLPPDQQAIAREAYERSLRAVFHFAVTISLFGFFVRLLIPQLSLDRPQGGTSAPASRDVEGTIKDGELQRLCSDDGNEADDELTTGRRLSPSRRSFEGDEGRDGIPMGLKSKW